MARNPLIRVIPQLKPTNTLHKSAGILDDFAIRKSIQVKETHSQSILLNITSETSTYTALRTDHTILCNGTFTVTLPTASTVKNIMYNIKNIGTGTITVDGAGSETIDGGTTAVLSSQFACITVQSDGSNWHII